MAAADFFLFFFAEEKGHEQAHDEGETHGADDPGQTQIKAQHPGGEEDGQDIDARTAVEEGRGRP